MSDRFFTLRLELRLPESFMGALSKALAAMVERNTQAIDIGVVTFLDWTGDEVDGAAMFSNLNTIAISGHFFDLLARLTDEEENV